MMQIEYDLRLHLYNVSIAADKLIEQGKWLKQNGQVQEAQRLFDAAENLRS